MAGPLQDGLTQESSMHARVTTFQSNPSGIDEGIKTAREQVIPAASKVAGFRGMLALADRTTGKTIGITFWDDQEALQRSEQFASQLRATTGAASNTAVVSVDRFEVVVNEMSSPQLT
jgi:heme-degrading monooxygenase HmoA